MANKPTKLAKTESLTIRLDPKMRFALDFVARMKGQSITMVLERIIKQAADNEYTSSDIKEHRSWVDYWDISDGVRYIHLANDDATFPSFDEEEIINFIKVHWQFFSRDKIIFDLRKDNIDVLWPHISELMHHWRQNKSKDRNITGWKMQDLLENASVLFIPHWPQSENTNIRRNNKAPDIPF